MTRLLLSRAAIGDRRVGVVSLGVPDGPGPNEDGETLLLAGKTRQITQQGAKSRLLGLRLATYGYR